MPSISIHHSESNKTRHFFRGYIQSSALHVQHSEVKKMGSWKIFTIFCFPFSNWFLSRHQPVGELMNALVIEKQKTSLQSRSNSWFGMRIKSNIGNRIKWGMRAPEWDAWRSRGRRGGGQRSPKWRPCYRWRTDSAAEILSSSPLFRSAPYLQLEPPFFSLYVYCVV